MNFRYSLLFIILLTSCFDMEFDLDLTSDWVVLDCAYDFEGIYEVECDCEYQPLSQFIEIDAGVAYYMNFYFLKENYDRIPSYERIVGEIQKTCMSIVFEPRDYIPTPSENDLNKIKYIYSGEFFYSDGNLNGELLWEPLDVSFDTLKCNYNLILQ